MPDEKTTGEEYTSARVLNIFDARQPRVENGMDQAPKTAFVNLTVI
jgi:hypothetical protein